MKKRKNQNRRFSEAFRKEKVKLIDEGKISVRGISKLYEVSDTAVYNWINKFSTKKRDERIVVEKVSESRKTEELFRKVRDLEQVLGRKQMEIEYFKEVIQITNETLGEDIEKKHKPKQ
tara:strand:+ start:60 stop:416 length:357 start_codon:yes stop_codon:yes gene_type:complete